eukprot:CAMPEP_0180260236 /NCGR_PEP_ID=MMETSP0987-20121128/43469_1 /TAXON_ID=697907 /ORGANISM="non described non described, Strain CCMP2293" /LENGTH=46 /DNA_ID= /DNA_START= /DNA_END= /DNA_ORIENTATION=
MARAGSQIQVRAQAQDRDGAFKRSQERIWATRESTLKLVWAHPRED